MKITIATLFPEMVEGFFASSIMKRAVERGIIDYQIINWRGWAEDRHQSCDDIPYGGGAGMVITCEPLFKALDALGTRGKRVIYPSPSGRSFDQAYAEELSGEEELLFICGHYEGLDQRIIDEYVTDEISIGDYVISSGEVATLVIVDALYRLIDGVITDDPRLYLDVCERFEDEMDGKVIRPKMGLAQKAREEVRAVCSVLFFQVLVMAYHIVRRVQGKFDYLEDRKSLDRR